MTFFYSKNSFSSAPAPTRKTFVFFLCLCFLWLGIGTAVAETAESSEQTQPPLASVFQGSKIQLLHSSNESPFWVWLQSPAQAFMGLGRQTLLYRGEENKSFSTSLPIRLNTAAIGGLLFKEQLLLIYPRYLHLLDLQTRLPKNLQDAALDERFLAVAGSSPENLWILSAKKDQSLILTGPGNQVQLLETTLPQILALHSSAHGIGILLSSVNKDDKATTSSELQLLAGNIDFGAFRWQEPRSLKEADPNFSFGGFAQVDKELCLLPFSGDQALLNKSERLVSTSLKGPADTVRWISYSENTQAQVRALVKNAKGDSFYYQSNPEQRLELEKNIEGSPSSLSVLPSLFFFTFMGGFFFFLSFLKRQRRRAQPLSSIKNLATLPSAPPLPRVLAFIIDFFINILPAFLLFNLLFPQDLERLLELIELLGINPDAAEGALFGGNEIGSISLHLTLLSSGTLIFYSTLSEFFFGCTLGKNLFDLRVVSDLNQNSPSFQQCLLRNLPKFLFDFILLLNFIFCFFSKTNKSLGDYFGHCRVLRLPREDAEDSELI